MLVYFARRVLVLIKSQGDFCFAYSLKFKASGHKPVTLSCLHLRAKRTCLSQSVQTMISDRLMVEYRTFHQVMMLSSGPKQNKRRLTALIMLSLDTTRFPKFHWCVGFTASANHPLLFYPLSDVHTVTPSSLGVGDWLWNHPSSPKSSLQFEEIPDTHISLKLSCRLIWSRWAGLGRLWTSGHYVPW